MSSRLACRRAWWSQLSTVRRTSTGIGSCGGTGSGKNTHSGTVRVGGSGVPAHWITPSSAANEYLLGLTEAALDTGIPGDVDGIVLDEPSRRITIHYSGLSMSSADELYHTIYENVEGKYLVEIPFLAAGQRQVRKVELNPLLIERPSLLSSSIWIAKLHVYA